jgi:hypothetical protein
MASKSSILDELKREEMELAEELSKYRAPIKNSHGGGRKPLPVSDEEKKEIRKARSRIAYRKRQLKAIHEAKQSPQSYQDESESPDEPSPTPAPKMEQPKRAGRKRALAKQSEQRQLPEPPKGSGVQMVFVPGDSEEYKDHIVVEDDEDGFQP